MCEKSAKNLGILNQEKKHGAWDRSCYRSEFKQNYLNIEKSRGGQKIRESKDHCPVSGVRKSIKRTLSKKKSSLTPARE